jgi:hypothetical protein
MKMPVKMPTLSKEPKLNLMGITMSKKQNTITSSHTAGANIKSSTDKSLPEIPRELQMLRDQLNSLSNKVETLFDRTFTVRIEVPVCVEASDKERPISSLGCEIRELNNWVQNENTKIQCLIDSLCL